MKKSKRPAPFFWIAFLLVVGFVAFIQSLRVLDRGLARPGAGMTIAILVGVFFIAYTWALFLFLHWRDQQRAARRMPPVAVQPRPELDGTVYGLLAGAEYQVQQAFTDYYGNVFKPSEQLKFKERHFLPYDGGHTIIFEQCTLYLQEDQNRAILENFAEYIAQIQP